MTTKPTAEAEPLLHANLEALLTIMIAEDQRHLPLPEAPKSGRQAQKDQRLQELLSRCREEALQQIVGPFGLTPAMFNDIQGGNVTTQHNANQDIYAKESEGYNRGDYDYAAAKRKKKNEAVKNGEMNSQEFTDTYTGEKASTKRTTENGKVVMNAELDHTIPLKQAHKEGGWMLSEERRKTLASEEDNLNYTTFENNRTKSDTAAEEALSAEKGYDESRTKPIIDKARDAINEHLPSTGERLKHHGKELALTGAKEFGKAGLRRAMGVLLFEFVNGSFVEVHAVVRTRDSEETLLNRLIAAIERVLKRVQGKFKDAFAEFFKGGLQGFISNLLTFLINNLVTTSAKVVTIIRESMHKLWEALKMLLWPPKGMPTSEVMRVVTKSIAGLFTLGAGMLWEQSVNAFLLSIPVLAPIAGMISPVITGLLTGIATALLMYGIDSLIDWMLDKGTDYINAQINTLEGYSELATRMAEQIEVQFQLSAGYRQMLQANQAIAEQFNDAELAMSRAVHQAQTTVQDQDATIAALATAIDVKKSLNDKLDELLKRYSKES